MDFGLLVIANSIMRTRLSPKQKVADGGAALRSVLKDIPFLIYALGIFLVSMTSNKLRCSG